jgi:hypothetical protein
MGRKSHHAKKKKRKEEESGDGEGTWKKGVVLIPDSQKLVAQKKLKEIRKNFGEIVRASQKGGFKINVVNTSIGNLRGVRKEITRFMQQERLRKEDAEKFKLLKKTVTWYVDKLEKARKSGDFGRRKARIGFVGDSIDSGAAKFKKTATVEELLNAGWEKWLDEIRQLKTNPDVSDKVKWLAKKIDFAVYSDERRYGTLEGLRGFLLREVNKEQPSGKEGNAFRRVLEKMIEGGVESLAKTLGDGLNKSPTSDRVSYEILPKVFRKKGVDTLRKMASHGELDCRALFDDFTLDEPLTPAEKIRKDLNVTDYMLGFLTDRSAGE